MTNDLKRLAMDGTATERMPLLFVGHGNPLNAIEDNPFSRAWTETGAALPVPKAILSVSAHWLTRGTRVLSAERPQTIHDFGGFPPEMYRQQYPAPGAPAMAREAQELAVKHHVSLDDDWGFDHGTWSVLKQMFPAADIPVYQLSIDYSKPMEYHYGLAQEIRALRDKGVMVVGSGNIVHNLRAINWQANAKPYDWALEFDASIKQWIEQGNHKAILDFQRLGQVAQLAHPTYDHFLPLLYVLGFQHTREEPLFFNDAFDMASVSMRSMLYRS
ncbi:MAG: 4,5-DOPA dioxygenase extradiol [Bacteroidetes bacterium]|nr:4,5-DOPA dioxygenase extradiol [Bacteroidota bacterium]